MVVTPLSNGDLLVETNNGSATAEWVGPTGGDRLIDAVHGVTVNYDNGDPAVHVGVEDDVVTSVIQEDGWGISFDRRDDGGYLGRFTSPDGASETFTLPALGGDAPAAAARPSLPQGSNPVFYVETQCQGRRSYTQRTAVTTRITLAETNERLYSATVLENVAPGRGFYTFAVPSQIPEQAQQAYLDDIRNDCEDIIVPIQRIKWGLVEAVCSASDKVNNPAFVGFCRAIGVADLVGLKDLLTTRTSEGGLVIDCLLLDLFLRTIPFDADIVVSADAWDPDLGTTDPVRRSYDSFDHLFNTSITLSYSDPERCAVEQWSLMGRCVGQTRDAFVLGFSLQPNAEQGVSGSGNGIDYDGSYLIVNLDGQYLPGDERFYGSLHFTDSDGGRRQDSFTTTLSSDDTGYFGTTIVSHNGPVCTAEIRVAKTTGDSPAASIAPFTGGSGDGPVFTAPPRQPR